MMNKNKKSSQRYSPVERAQSSLSVSAVDCFLSLPVINSPSPAISTITLTPGRIRNIDQDMEALRVSRQDNPFIQQVIASRESLDNLEDIESDDTNLMAKELSMDLDTDPMSLPEIHEHMIRSPPPTSWPKSPNHAIFSFPGEDEFLHVEVNTKEKGKQDKIKHSSWDGSESISPLKSITRAHSHHPDRFSLLTGGNLRSCAEDSVRLMSED